MKLIYKLLRYFFTVFLMVQYSYAENSITVLHHNPFNKPEDINLKLDLHNNSELKQVKNTLSLPKLQAILLSEHLPMVIVGDVILSPGKEINGYKLIKVKKNGAVFKKAMRTYTVKLEPVQSNQNELE